MSTRATIIPSKPVRYRETHYSLGVNNAVLSLLGPVQKGHLGTSDIAARTIGDKLVFNFQGPGPGQTISVAKHYMIAYPLNRQSIIKDCMLAAKLQPVFAAFNTFYDTRGLRHNCLPYLTPRLYLDQPRLLTILDEQDEEMDHYAVEDKGRGFMDGLGYAPQPSAAEDNSDRRFGQMLSALARFAYMKSNGAMALTGLQGCYLFGRDTDSSDGRSARFIVSGLTTHTMAGQSCDDDGGASSIAHFNYTHRDYCSGDCRRMNGCQSF